VHVLLNAKHYSLGFVYRARDLRSRVILSTTFRLTHTKEEGSLVVQPKPERNLAHHGNKWYDLRLLVFCPPCLPLLPTPATPTENRRYPVLLQQFMGGGGCSTKCAHTTTTHIMLHDNNLFFRTRALQLELERHSPTRQAACRSLRARPPLLLPTRRPGIRVCGARIINVLFTSPRHNGTAAASSTQASCL